MIQPLFAQSQRVERVIDGDTFVLTDGRRVRMLGIDTPELRYREYYAEEASDRLRELIDGRKVVLQSDIISADTDRYGRILRYVLYQDRDINLQLIEEGYARAYVKYKIERLPDYIEAEDRARKKGLGVWQEEAAIATGRQILFYGLGLAIILFIAFWQTMRRIRKRRR